MRTKHLLYTLALAGAFTACTQDEFVAENGADALAGRKSLGKVSFVEDGADTRWGVNANFANITPKKGDGMSVCLVDVPYTGLDGQHAYPIDNYQITDYISSNFFFEFDGTNWSNEANLVEGNYVFVAPTDAKHLGRNPFEATLPAVQNLKLLSNGEIDPTSAIDEMAASGTPFYVGHRFLSEGGTVKAPRWSHIYSFPLITIENANDQHFDITITKVIIKQNRAGKQFVLNAPFSHTGIAKALTNEYFEAAGNDSKDQVVLGDWAAVQQDALGYGEAVKNEKKGTKIADDAEFEITTTSKVALDEYTYNNGLDVNLKTSDLLAGKPTSTADYIVVNMPNNAYKLAYGKSFSFNAIVPADTYVLNNNEDLTIYVVLSDGSAWTKEVASRKEVHLLPGKRYAYEDYTGTSVRPDVAGYFTIKTSEKVSDGLGTFKHVVDPTGSNLTGNVVVVKSSEELNKAVLGIQSQKAMTIVVNAKGVEFTQTTVDNLANTQCQKLTIQGNIAIKAEAGKELVLPDFVSFEDAVVTEGKVVAESDKIDIKEIVVNKGAELKLQKLAENALPTVYNAGGTLELNVAAVVDNYGLIKVAGGSNKEKTVIENKYGQCVDKEGHIISNAVNLKPSVEVVPGGVYVAPALINFPIQVDAADPANNLGMGELCIEKNTELAEYKEGNNYGKGTIVNEGLIRKGGRKQISGDPVLTIPAGFEVENKKDAVINKTVALTINAVDLENKIDAGLLKNGGGVAAAITLGGKIEMTDGAAQLTSTTLTAAGEIPRNYYAEIDNTVRGAIAATGVPEGVKVYAEVDALGMFDGSELNELSKYGEGKSNKVREIRLTGVWTISGDLNLTDKNFTTTIAMTTGSSIVFTDDATLTVAASQISLNGKDIKAVTNGKTASISEAATRGYYLDKQETGWVISQGSADKSNPAETLN